MTKFTPRRALISSTKCRTVQTSGSEHNFTVSRDTRRKRRTSIIASPPRRLYFSANDTKNVERISHGRNTEDVTLLAPISTASNIGSGGVVKVATTQSNRVVLNTQKFLQNRDTARQISPASASSDHAVRSCGLCGFIPVVCTRRNNVSCERECSAIIIEDHSTTKKPPNHIYLLSNSTQQQQHRETRSMDRSVDSIGSCSLDVDAESTDFSDTSGSFNLLTPSSAKDFPREFITRIHERSQCPPAQSVIHRQQTSIVLDPQSGRINTILSGQPPPPTIVESPPPGVDEPKKPSYLNLACCVNGYSHLTTYDSKLRQNINKSREVSPIRPITTYASLQSYTKTDSSGLKHLIVPNPPSTNRYSGDWMDSNRSMMSPEKRLFTQHMMATESNGTEDTTDNVVKHFRTTKYIHTMSTTTTKKIVDDNSVETQQQFKTGSIAQHVERLFGPGALSQGFHTNRRSTENGQTAVLTEKSMNSRNYFSPVVKMTRKEALANGDGQQERNGTTTAMNGGGVENLKDLEVALPVFRHLRPEFREQLPICSSPRRYVPPTRENHSSQTNGTTTIAKLPPSPEIIHPVKSSPMKSTPAEPVEKKSLAPTTIGDAPNASELADKASESSVKDGNHFLQILGKERARILAVADKVEMYTDEIKDNEEIVGYVRAATGKGRLLAAQKMKQFEELCHNNLTQSPEEKFQTTSEDLQGFWDMVMLQVNHVDQLFDEIETLKANNWKKKAIQPKAPPQGAKLTKKPIASKVGTTSGQRSAAATLAAQKRDAQRKQLMELKRKNRMELNQQNGDDVGATSKSNGHEKA
ncbi:disks large-associated protein 1 [Sergentomyia squamirostris]